MIACLLIRDFAAAFERRAHPQLSSQPLGLLSTKGGRRQVLACSPEAWNAGVRPGMSAKGARSVCPAVVLIAARPYEYQKAQRDLVEMLTRYSPRLELEQGDQSRAVIWLDLGSLKRDALNTLANRLLTDLEAQTGMRGSVGIAAGKFPAYAAALKTAPGNCRVLTVENPRAFLGDLPLDVLSLDGEMARRLALLRIRTVGDFASLPADAIFMQFGKRGLAWHQQARGRDDRPLIAYQPPRVLERCARFEDALEDRLLVNAALRRIGTALGGCLIKDGLAVRTLVLTVVCADHAVIEFSTRARKPLGGALLTAAAERLLEKARMRSGVAELRLMALDLTPAQPDQLPLFADFLAAEQRVSAVGERLRGRYPTLRMVRPLPQQMPLFLPDVFPQWESLDEVVFG